MAGQFHRDEPIGVQKMILACTNHAHVTVHHEFGEYSAAYSSWRKKHRAKQCAEVGGWALGLVKEVDTIQRAVIAQIPAELKARMEKAIIEKHGEEHKVGVEKELNKKLTVAQALELKPLFNFQGKLFSKQFFLSQADTLDVMFDVFGEGATAPQKGRLPAAKGCDASRGRREGHACCAALGSSALSAAH